MSTEFPRIQRNILCLSFIHQWNSIIHFSRFLFETSTIQISVTSNIYNIRCKRCNTINFILVEFVEMWNNKAENFQFIVNTNFSCNNGDYHDTTDMIATMNYERRGERCHLAVAGQARAHLICGLIKSSFNLVNVDHNRLFVHLI